VISKSIFIYLAGNNYVPNFPMFERSDVNGYGEQPLFTFLKVSLKKINVIYLSVYFKSLCPSPIDEFHPWPNITYAPMRSNDLRWNFEKVISYLILYFI
jgi:glutathione peroxidase